MSREDLFRQTIRENHKCITRICGYYFSDSDDRDDAIQETLIRIWENLPSFKGHAKLSTWSYRVTVNTCLSRLRSNKRRNGRIETGLNSLDQHAEIPSEDDSRGEEQKLVFFRKFLERLGNADRTLVTLYLEELSTSEIAEITGLSEVNVRVRIHRIKEKIKTEWEEKQHGTG